MNKLSQIPLSPQGGFSGPGTGSFAVPASSADTGLAFAEVISGIIGVMTVIAGIWFLFNTLVGAIGIVTSGGDKASYEGARKRITTGVIGIIVVVSAIFLVDVLGQLIGFNTILDPGGFIQLFNQ